MNIIEQFNEKLQTLVDEESFSWQQIIFSEPDNPETIARLKEKTAIPEELATLLLTDGAIKSEGFADAWQTVQLFSAQELIDMPLGIVNFIDYYWGGRPEFEEFFSLADISILNQRYQIFGLKYLDDNVHDYWFFDQQHKFGHLLFDQDDCSSAMEQLKELLVTSNLTFSLEELIRDQLAGILEEV